MSGSYWLEVAIQGSHTDTSLVPRPFRKRIDLRMRMRICSRKGLGTRLYRHMCLCLQSATLKVGATI